MTQLDLEKIYDCLLYDLTGFNTEKESEGYSFKVKTFRYGEDDIPKAFYDACLSMYQIAGKTAFTYTLKSIDITLSMNKETTSKTLILKSQETEFLLVYRKGAFRIKSAKYNDAPKLLYYLYENGEMRNFTPKKGETQISNKKTFVSGQGKRTKSFPCSMKDLFYYQNSANAEHIVFFNLFKALGQQYPLWNKLADDFYNGTIYSSLPLHYFFEYDNYLDIVKDYYGYAAGTGDTIGNAIFLARIGKYVTSNLLEEIAKKNLNLPPHFVSRDKKTISKDLFEILNSVFSRIFYFNSSLLERGLEVCLKQRIVIPEFKNSEQFEAFFNDILFKDKVRTIPTFKEDTKFKKLNMPKDYFKVTTRKELASICDTETAVRIAQKINEGKISVWKTLGKNFVTIKMKKSKNFPKGYYLIDENHGIWNVDALKEHLKGQGFV